MAEAGEPTPRTVRQARYRKVLAVVQAQRPEAGEPPLGAPVHSVTQIANTTKPFREAERGHSKKVLRQAQERGDVLLQRAVDGTWCAIRTTEAGLAHALEIETGREHPRQGVVAAINQARADDDLPQTPPEVLRRGE